MNPLENEATYQEVLDHIEALWGAIPKTPEGDKLEILMALVEAYENKHYPISLDMGAEISSKKLTAQVRKQSSLVAAGHQNEAEIDNWLMNIADTEEWERNGAIMASYGQRVLCKIIDLLHLQAVAHGRVAVEPKPRPHYTLTELLAASDYSRPQPAEEREWVDAPSVGGELL